MSETVKNTIDIVLWGETTAGKTTALAAYFCHQTPDWVDVQDHETLATLVRLRTLWNELQSNRVPIGTVQHQYYCFRNRKTNDLLRFRDMRGGNSGNLNQQDLDDLQRSNAVMFFAQWSEQNTMVDCKAIRNALAHSHGKPQMLVITKAESFLRPDEFLSFHADPLGKGQEKNLPDSLLKLIQNTPCLLKNVFPISVYGFDKGYPAVFRDEFGRLVPSSPSPCFVDLAFKHLRELLYDNF